MNARKWIDRIRGARAERTIERPRFSGVDPSRWKLAPSSEDRPDVEGHPLRVLAALIDRGEEAPLCHDAGALLADLGQDRLYELLTLTAGLMDDDRVRMALREVRSSLEVARWPVSVPTEPGWYLVRVEDVGEVAERGPMVEADILKVHERITKERAILIEALAHAAQEFNDMRVATGFFDAIQARATALPRVTAELQRTGVAVEAASVEDVEAALESLTAREGER